MEIITYVAVFAAFAAAINMGFFGFILLAATIALRLSKKPILYYVAVLPFSVMLHILLRRLGYGGEFSTIAVLFAAAWFLFVVYQKIHGTFTRQHMKELLAVIKRNLLEKGDKDDSEDVDLPDMDNLPDLDGV